MLDFDSGEPITLPADVTGRSCQAGHQGRLARCLRSRTDEMPQGQP